jgi:glycerophosphoryl diester phosphodiesterase
MQIMGHRGAAGLAPENSIAAIVEGLTAGADWIEFDVRRTQDGHIVLVHDRTTRRIAHKRLTIRKSAMRELQELEMKRGQAIPTLEEAIDIIGKKAKINIEIKSPDCVPQVVEIIQKYVKQGFSYSHFLISSFSPAVLRSAYRLDKKVPYGLLQIWPVRFRWLRSVKLSAVGFYHISALTPFIVALAKRKELYTYAYTVNSVEEAKQLKRLGIDGIVTNYPDRFEALRAEP